MTSLDLFILMPLIIIAGGAVLTLPVISVRRNHRFTVMLTLLILVLSFISLFRYSDGLSYEIPPMFIIDSYALFFLALIFGASFGLTILSYDYLNKLDVNREEYYLLILLATLGSAILIMSQHFISFFLGLEVLGVSLYTLISYVNYRKRGTEAGIKYLILAASASAFLLFGMALVYFDTGTMTFGKLFNILADGQKSLILFSGIALMIVGIGFKLAVFPFHMWTADVYEGAPAPVTAFIATVSKGSMFVLILRFFLAIEINESSSLFYIFLIISVASMFTGNLLALRQNNIKRILAYSSIAHLGYLFVAFLAGRTLGLVAIAFYLVAYFITMIGAFAIISVLSGKKEEVVNLDDYRGLYWRHPWLSAVLTTMLFSLAGIPLTAGFIAKFYVLIAGIKATLWLLVFVFVANSAISLYYYLRIIMIMFSKYEKERSDIKNLEASVPVSSGAILAVLTILLIWAGIYPSQLIEKIHSIVSNLIVVASQTMNMFP